MAGQKQYKEGSACPIEFKEGRYTKLGSVVKNLCQTNSKMIQRMCQNGQHRALPSLTEVISIVEDLRSVLFPGYFGEAELDLCSMEFHVGSTLDRVSRNLKDQINRGLCFACTGEEDDQPQKCEENAALITREFLNRLSKVQHLLETDIRATYMGDPAAPNIDEIIFCYPNILAITNYRLAHELYELGVPIIPRMITEHAHSITGIDIHPHAEIGESFFIDHGTGVVIGATSVIGNRVKIYQGVTLGAKAFTKDEEGKAKKGINRHPIVEDDVVIYSGATILGRITIGRGSVIGGNVWLTQSVPEGGRITQSEIRYEKFIDGGGI